MFKRKTFLEKLTGSISLRDSEVPADELEEGEELIDATKDEAGELSVDVYQTPSEIMIKTMVAGVKPEDLDIAISRDMVTIRGERQETRQVDNEDYFHKELYWGAFARTILLPAEIDVEEAEATEKHGLLILRLPKIDKNRTQNIKVKSV